MLPHLRTLTLLLALSACSNVDSAWLHSPITDDTASDSGAIADASSPDVVAVDASLPPDTAGIDATVDVAAADRPAPPDVTADVAIDSASLVDAVIQPDVATAIDAVQPDVTSARCGDRICSAGESCASCPADCVCDTCAGATNCNACAMMASCGWCRGSSRCTRGSGSGSSDGLCTGANWAWQTGDCPSVTDPCLRFTDCRTCAGQSTCGWCASTGRCLTGSSSAPSMGTCSRWIPYQTGCGG